MFRRWSNSQETHALQPDAKVDELKAALGPLSGRDLKYCTDACLRRYLEARKWNVDKSKKMLEETLKWRSTYKPEEIRWHEIATEGETGKLFRANFHDRHGRSVLIMNPGLQNTVSMDNQIRYVVYQMENALLNLPEDQEQMAWLVDFTGWSPTNVPIGLARETVNILQNHYPERLAVAFLFNPPRLFEAFWRVSCLMLPCIFPILEIKRPCLVLRLVEGKTNSNSFMFPFTNSSTYPRSKRMLSIIKFFLDPITFEKAKFVYPMNKDSVEIMKSYFDVDNLPTEFGGKATLKYDHEEFARMMVEDDEKTAALWGFSDKHKLSSIRYEGTEVTPEPTPPLAPPAS